MNRIDLQRRIAETAYNVGFGAKKHFATHDIVAKVPGSINFVSVAVGIFALVVDALSSDYLSATLLVLGVLGIYVTRYMQHREDYASTGKSLTHKFNQLKALYAQSETDTDLESIEKTRSEIEDQFNAESISDQILMSDWFAHYKFFWQHQTDWIEKSRRFALLRDKIPLTLQLTVGTALLVLAVTFWPSVSSTLDSLFSFVLR